MTRNGKMAGRSSPNAGPRIRRERGYAMLALLLMASLLMIGAAAVAPSIALEIRRDRETELIHRAMQYRRAVRRFTKQTGRYPMKLEDLESTNGVRYLRRRYKDPVTGREFRLLHMADIPAAMGTSTNAWSLQPGTGGDNAAQDRGNNSDGQDQQSSRTAPADSSTSSSNNQANRDTNQSTNQVLGGGVIIGIASTSTKKTIREFNHKSQYNQWLFFYDPGYERPFEVQGPTPLTHPPAALQNPPSASGQPSQASPPQATPALPSPPQS
jgi:type II secretory pathway pseudopilin PulG